MTPRRDSFCIPQSQSEDMMEDLTFVCTERFDTRMETTFTFKQTTWFTASGEGENIETEDVHWSVPGAEPFEDNGAKLTLKADADEYEVGRHYAFVPTGPLTNPADEDFE